MTSDVIPRTDWWSRIVADPPFNVHVIHRLEDARFLVGDSAKEYLAQFMTMYARALGSSLVTTVAGDPGSGKSYLFAHLRYRMLATRDPPGIPVVCRLMGRDYRAVEFLREIRASEGYRQALQQLGRQPKPADEERIFPVFVEEMADVQKQLPQTVLCLFVDNVDEYVRLMGTARRLRDGVDETRARQEAFLSLLRVLNSVNELAGSGICSVLSLTTDVVNICHLGDSREEGNLVAGLMERDSSVRRRFFPIYDTPDSTRLHTFGGMTLLEAQEMVAMNLDSWFARHPEVRRESPAESMVGRWNLFPFDTSAIELVAGASVVPGEIILACLAALHRYHNLRRELSEMSLGTGFEPPYLITPSLAASALLQMGQYFRVGAPGSLSSEELRARVLSDPLFQYVYVLPQEVSRLRLADATITRNLGLAFTSFLRRIIRSGLEAVATEPTFIKTRGSIRFPRFPTLDSVIRYDGKLFGVQFLADAEPVTVESKIGTARLAVRAEEPGAQEQMDHVHCVLFVCITTSSDGNPMKSRVLNSVQQPKSGFVNLQGRDYRPRVALASVGEEVAWSWRALASGDFLGEPEKDLLAILFEDVDATMWENAEGRPRLLEQRMKWRELLQKASTLSDEPPMFVKEERPDSGAWER